MLISMNPAIVGKFQFALVLAPHWLGGNRFHGSRRACFHSDRSSGFWASIVYFWRLSLPIVSFLFSGFFFPLGATLRLAVSSALFAFGATQQQRLQERRDMPTGCNASMMPPAWQ